MSLTAVNVTWFGNTLAQGQTQAQGGISGSQSRVLTGIATFTGNAGTDTTGTVNWIDGVQKPFQTIQFLPVLSAAAPVTINGVTNQAVYSGVGSYGQLKVGQSITIAGFATAGNNLTTTIVALTTSTIQVTNASAAAETNPAATLSFNNATGALVAGAFASRSVTSAAGVADTGAITTTAAISSITQTGAIVTLGAASVNGQTYSVIIQLFPNQ